MRMRIDEVKNILSEMPSFFKIGPVGDMDVELLCKVMDKFPPEHLTNIVKIRAIHCYGPDGNEREYVDLICEDKIAAEQLKDQN